MRAGLPVAKATLISLKKVALKKGIKEVSSKLDAIDEYHLPLTEFLSGHMAREALFNKANSLIAQAQQTYTHHDIQITINVLRRADQVKDSNVYTTDIVNSRTDAKPVPETKGSLIKRINADLTHLKKVM